jgi:hypothetical protein
MAKITAKITSVDGIAFETSIPPNFNENPKTFIKKSLEYARNWYQWKTNKTDIGDISILQWNYDTKVWEEKAHSHK